MPNVMTIAESEYAAAFAEYQVARVAFYAGSVSPADFIKARAAMETASAAWEAEREAA